METIAFLGLGQMGAPIAERLIDSGFKVRVFDPRTEAMAPLVRRGGIATTSPREAVAGVEIAFACLPSPEVSRAVAFEGRGDDDYTSLIKVIERWANVVVGGNESGPAERR